MNGCCPPCCDGLTPAASRRRNSPRTSTCRRTSSCARPRASRNGGSGSARYAATALGGDNFDVSAYYDLLAPLSAHVDVWETNYYHALPGYEAILDWYRGTGLRPYLAQLPDDGLYLQVLRASVERAIDFSYARGLVSRPATCFDGGCRRQGASPVPYQWFARQEGGCDGVHHIGLRREVPAENRGQDRRGHARRR